MRCIALLLVLLSGLAHADWEDGSFPEGSTAATVKRHEFRLNLIGKSAFGITDRVELSSYLPLVIFPNLGLKVRLLDAAAVKLAFEVDLGAGALPLVGGGALPFPGGVLAGGAGGLLLGSVQLGELHLSLKPAHAWTVSARVAGIAMEGGFLGLGGGAVAGGGGAGGVILPLAFGKAATAVSGGLELDVVLDERNALSAQGDFMHLAGVYGGLVLFSAAWTHAWEHVHLQVGVYNTFGVPWTEPPKLPVAPFVNVYWVFNRAPVPGAPLPPPPPVPATLAAPAADEAPVPP
ncbi:MAG: hypothetical protein K1X89_20805, partial [Myxococcaceae bacterium]|nr:hypothetical protein [Myxococcaceae bacterium]